MSSVDVPIFPLPNAQMFPQALLPLHVFEPRYREMVRDAMAGERLIGVALLEPGYEEDYAGRPPVRTVLGVGRIIAHEPLPDGRSNILLRGEYRARIVRELEPQQAYRMVRLEVIEDLVPPNGALEVRDTLMAVADQLSVRLPSGGETLRTLVRSVTGTGALADVLAAALITDSETRQRLLETPDVVARARDVVDQVGLLLARLADHQGPLN
jgi:Lon protease-like protein